MTIPDWPSLIEPVALAVLGEPKQRKRGEWRYRGKGSLVVHVDGPRRGTWHDFEANAGGGVLGLLQHVEGLDRADARDWLRAKGLLPPDDGPSDNQAWARGGGRGSTGVRGGGRPRNVALRAT